MPKRHLRSTLNVAPPTTIGFRLDEASLRILAERAKRLGLSIHELARHYVIEVLQEPEERSALREAVETVQREIMASREDLAVATEAILVSSGNIEESQARKWVDENLKTACSPSRHP